jgi:AraC-like DNA-binding protein
MPNEVDIHISSVNVTMKASLLINAAEDFLRDSPPRPIYIYDLCKALDVSYRTLYAAFMMTRGESPALHLKRRRLVMAHQVLSNAGSEALLVKTVALDHGFWHFGNFSQDYRKLFGETPSETLALARSRANMLPRDAQQHTADAASNSAVKLRHCGPIQTRHGAPAASSHGEAGSILQGRQTAISSHAASNRA